MSLIFSSIKWCVLFLVDSFFSWPFPVRPIFSARILPNSAQFFHLSHGSHIPCSYSYSTVIDSSDCVVKPWTFFFVIVGSGGFFIVVVITLPFPYYLHNCRLRVRQGVCHNWWFGVCPKSAQISLFLLTILIALSTIYLLKLSLLEYLISLIVFLLTLIVVTLQYYHHYFHPYHYNFLIKFLISIWTQYCSLVVLVFIIMLLFLKSLLLE